MPEFVQKLTVLSLLAMAYAWTCVHNSGPDQSCPPAPRQALSAKHADSPIAGVDVSAKRPNGSALPEGICLTPHRQRSQLDEVRRRDLEAEAIWPSGGRLVRLTRVVQRCTAYGVVMDS